jgi:CDP-4-dehydro-6-deoxyglucose reductase, E1
MTRREQIFALIREEMAGYPELEHDAARGLPLQVVPFGADEVIAATDRMLDTWVTMGPEVYAFEDEYAAWCGARHGVMCNSGSSANLLMLAGLVETGRLQRGDEVLVPAVGWSTSLFPVEQVGLVPVLVDVEPDTLCLCPHRAAEAIGPRTRAALAVHMLGMPTDCDALEALGLDVIEDACAAPGAARRGRRSGQLGHAASFSFFFSHHITSFEGGIVVTDDPGLADAMRSLRAHGWVRERTDRQALIDASPEIDERFLFVSTGYNLRPTELAGAVARIQLKRLDGFLARRQQNHRSWCALLADLDVQLFPEPPGVTSAAFAFGMVLPEGVDRRAVQAHLEAHNIATRPISGSNLARQPAFERLVGARVAGRLPVADAVHTRGLFVGNSHAFGEAHGVLLRDTLAEALRIAR